MTNPEVKAAKKVDSILDNLQSVVNAHLKTEPQAENACLKVESTLDRLKEAEIPREHALPLLVSIGEPAILPLIAAFQKRGHYAQNVILLALHKIGGDAPVATAIHGILEIYQENYISNRGEKSRDIIASNLSFIDRVALPALIGELAGEYHEFAAISIVEMGAGREAIPVLRKLSRSGENRTLWMERLVALIKCMDNRGMKLASFVPPNIDFSGIALEKSFRAPKAKPIRVPSVPMQRRMQH